jgi:outer membrane protein OmpA-like peptidoglycan-associated protein
MNCNALARIGLILSFASLAACNTPPPAPPAPPMRSIILMPDSDGHVGRAEVTTSGGRLLLDRAGDMTQVANPKAPPSKPVAADTAYIARTFGEALAVEPAPSKKFTLLFETGTATLTPASLREIATILSTSQQRKAINIAIRGHTDSVGSDAFNNKLAMDRAERVKAALLKEGIPPALIMLSSHGKGDPAFPTPNGVAEPRNRRVEVIVR